MLRQFEQRFYSNWMNVVGSQVAWAPWSDSLQLSHEITLLHLSLKYYVENVYDIKNFSIIIL
jgi:hypothetical protein